VGVSVAVGVRLGAGEKLITINTGVAPSRTPAVGKLADAPTWPPTTPLAGASQAIGTEAGLAAPADAGETNVTGWSRATVGCCVGGAVGARVGRSVGAGGGSVGVTRVGAIHVGASDAAEGSLMTNGKTNSATPSNTRATMFFIDLPTYKDTAREIHHGGTEGTERL